MPRHGCPRNDLPEPQRHTTSEIILSLGVHIHAWYDGLGAFWFVAYFFKNVSPKHVQKLIPNMPVLKLNLSFWSFFLEPSKSSFQSVSRQKHVSMVHLPVAKINYFPDGRTHAHSSFEPPYERKKRFAQWTRGEITKSAKKNQNIVPRSPIALLSSFCK